MPYLSSRSCRDDETELYIRGRVLWGVSQCSEQRPCVHNSTSVRGKVLWCKIVHRREGGEKKNARSKTGRLEDVRDNKKTKTKKKVGIIVIIQVSYIYLNYEAILLALE